MNIPTIDGWEFLEESSKVESNEKVAIYLVISSIDRNELANAKKMLSIYVINLIAPKNLKEICSLIKE